MDILEGFSLALLTQLNAYNIITKGGKGRFSAKKSTTQTQKYFTEPKQYTHFCKLFMVELAVLFKQVTEIRLSMSTKVEGSCPEV